MKVKFEDINLFLSQEQRAIYESLGVPRPEIAVRLVQISDLDEAAQAFAIFLGVPLWSILGFRRMDYSTDYYYYVQFTSIEKADEYCKEKWGNQANWYTKSEFYYNE